MTLFNTLKKKVGWAVGAITLAASAAYPYLPAEYKLAINAVVEITKQESKHEETAGN